MRSCYRIVARPMPRWRIISLNLLCLPRLASSAFRDCSFRFVCRLPLVGEPKLNIQWISLWAVWPIVAHTSLFVRSSMNRFNEFNSLNRPEDHFASHIESSCRSLPRLLFPLSLLLLSLPRFLLPPFSDSRRVCKLFACLPSTEPLPVFVFRSIAAVHDTPANAFKLMNTICGWSLL